MTKAHKIIICVIVAGLVLASVYVASCVIRLEKYKRGYAGITVGNSKQDVIELLGEPLEIGGCYGYQQCKEIYRYYFFLEEWNVVLNAEGNVIQKYYRVSP